MSRPPDPLVAIKALYFQTSKATILRDLDQAIDLLKALPNEEARARAAVYMDGLAQMRSEWGVKPASPAGRRPVSRRTPGTTPPRGSKPAR